MLTSIITPMSTVLRAATGIVTPYMVVVWVWLTILLCILQKKYADIDHRHRLPNKFRPWSRL